MTQKDMYAVKPCVKDEKRIYPHDSTLRRIEKNSMQRLRVFRQFRAKHALPTPTQIWHGLWLFISQSGKVNAKGDAYAYDTKQWFLAEFSFCVDFGRCYGSGLRATGNETDLK